MKSKELIKKQILEWQEQLNDIRDYLIVNNEKNSPDLVVMYSEALRLSMCITDLTNLLLEITEED